MSAPPPFALQSSPNFAELLTQLGCTLLVSTFQAGKVIAISAADDESLIQLPRNFQRPMGVAIKEDKMAVACATEVLYLKDNPDLATTYPKKPSTYDALYMPRQSIYTGPLDLHDIHFGASDTLYGVNTLFSCLSKIDNSQSFRPIWQPHFINDCHPIDACHLNGLAMEGDIPTYITGLGATTTARGWKKSILTGGILMHIASNEIICDSLPMPHTPRIYNGELYALCSAAEKLIHIDPNNGKTTDVCHVPGFVRGMAKIDDYVFIASSKLRKNASIFRDLPIANHAKTARITAIHLPTGSKVAQLQYNTSVDEIYDIQILPGCKRPNILTNSNEQVHQAISTDSDSYWQSSSSPPPHVAHSNSTKSLSHEPVLS